MDPRRRPGAARRAVGVWGERGALVPGHHSEGPRGRLRVVAWGGGGLLRAGRPAAGPMGRRTAASHRRKSGI